LVLGSLKKKKKSTSSKYKHKVQNSKYKAHSLSQKSETEAAVPKARQYESQGQALSKSEARRPWTCGEKSRALKSAG
jgi:hypothetical protein